MIVVDIVVVVPHFVQPTGAADRPGALGWGWMGVGVRARAAGWLAGRPNGAGASQQQQHQQHTCLTYVLRC